MKKVELVLVGSMAIAVGYKLGCKLYQYIKAKQGSEVIEEGAENSGGVMENNH